MPRPELILPRDPHSQLACKCCSGDAPFAVSIDFDKSTEPLSHPSGVLVHYYRCTRCGFMFTDCFDHFTHDDFLRHIYNDEYATIDPDYVDNRPLQTASQIMEWFPQARSRAILDYGGGNGRAAEYLRAAGCAHVDVYDPFVPGQSQLPQRTYDLVLCVEVVEHVPDPRRLFQELSTLAGDDGMVCLTTLLQPSNFAAPWTNWWYVAPRNGHVSLYTSAALGICAASVGMRGGSLNHLSHFLYRRQLPSFAARIRM